MKRRLQALTAWRRPAFLMFAESAPLDLRIVGRTLLHAAAVGVAAGLAGAAFFAGLEYFTRFVLDDLASYIPLRADRETFAASSASHTFRPWLLALLPALGGPAWGLIPRPSPRTGGGGGAWQRGFVLGYYLDLRREHAVRARAALSLRARTVAAVLAVGAADSRRLGRLSRRVSRARPVLQEVAGAGLGAARDRRLDAG